MTTTTASATQLSPRHAKPVPHPSSLSAPYWDGARANKLMLQRCGACSKVRHYPQVLCGACQSDQVEWIQSSMRGTLYSWTVTHHAFHPGFIADLPYTLVTVDMAEGGRVLGHYRGTTPLKINLPMQLRFEPDAQGTPVPVFDVVAG